MQSFTESIVEEAALAWLESLGYALLHSPVFAAGMPDAERGDPSSAVNKLTAEAALP